MDFNTLLVVCPLVFLGGFVDAVGGGGALIAVPAYLLAGIPPHMAIGTNKLSSCMGKAASIFKLARSGFVDWKLSPLPVLVSFVGSYAGASIALNLPPEVFEIILLVLLLWPRFRDVPSRVFFHVRRPGCARSFRSNKGRQHCGSRCSACDFRSGRTSRLASRIDCRALRNCRALSGCNARCQKRHCNRSAHHSRRAACSFCQDALAILRIKGPLSQKVDLSVSSLICIKDLHGIRT